MLYIIEKQQRMYKNLFCLHILGFKINPKDLIFVISCSATKYDINVPLIELIEHKNGEFNQPFYHNFYLIPKYGKVSKVMDAMKKILPDTFLK